MILVMMGVSGSGKSTLGRALAERLGWAFYEGDDYHSRTNIQKMRQGHPLTDEDRQPWFERLHRLLLEEDAQHHHLVLSCSALKETFRAFLAQDISQLLFVYLSGDADTIRQRLDSRQRHFMSSALLETQISTLEPPVDALQIPIQLPLSAQVELVVEAITPMMSGARHAS